MKKELLLELPKGAVMAEQNDLFTEEEKPKLIFGLTYYLQKGAVYKEYLTADYTNGPLLMSDIKLGWIYVIKN